MQTSLPRIDNVELNTLILDLNGTISVNGKLIDGVREKLTKLKEIGFSIYVFSGDVRGTARDLCISIGIELKICKSHTEKEEDILALSPDSTVAIGNGRIDIGMFRHAKLSIATLQAEGIHPAILPHVDILMTNINEAFDLLLDQETLDATLKQ
jgi:soluble P-type ATPase